MPVIRTCSQCQQKNRVAGKNLSLTGKCGACKAPLPPLAEPLAVDGTLFARSSRALRFRSSSISGRRGAAAAPEVARTAADMAGKALVLKVDTEANPQLSVRFGVRGIPNFVVLSGGKSVFQQAGLVGHEQMEQWLRSALAPI